MGKSAKWVIAILVVLSALSNGCTYNVAFTRPDSPAYTAKIPIDVAFTMSKKAKTTTYEGRAWSSGIANTWVIPVGDTIYQYALVYLPGAFRSFKEIERKGEVPSGMFLIQLDDIAYRMEGQAAHTTVSASVVSPTGKEVFKKSYSEDGPSGFGRVLAGGPFAQKSAIRQSTHVVLENTFKKLIEDIQAGYIGWMK